MDDEEEEQQRQHEDVFFVPDDSESDDEVIQDLENDGSQQEISSEDDRDAFWRRLIKKREYGSKPAPTTDIRVGTVDSSTSRRTRTRSADNLKVAWENMKKTAGKAASDRKKDSYSTGGGSSNGPRLTPANEAVLKIITVSATGLHNEFDGDPGTQLAPRQRTKTLCQQPPKDEARWKGGWHSTEWSQNMRCGVVVPLTFVETMCLLNLGPMICRLNLNPVRRRVCLNHKMTTLRQARRLHHVSVQKKFQLDQHKKTEKHKKEVNKARSAGGPAKTGTHRLISSFQQELPDEDTQFKKDLTEALLKANIPLNKLENDAFRNFLGRYTEKVRIVVQEFDDKDSWAIVKAKSALNDSKVNESLAFVKAHFGELPATITSLEKSEMPLWQAVEIIEGLLKLKLSTLWVDTRSRSSPIHNPDHSESHEYLEELESDPPQSSLAREYGIDSVDSVADPEYDPSRGYLTRKRKIHCGLTNDEILSKREQFESEAESDSQTRGSGSRLKKKTLFGLTTNDKEPKGRLVEYSCSSSPSDSDTNDRHDPQRFRGTSDNDANQDSGKKKSNKNHRNARPPNLQIEPLESSSNSGGRETDHLSRLFGSRWF
ncbi:hypothetical protein GE061_015380 [Apolygus lucorum]|uniref:Uncharacterized protein n=1 Tax=Apolygus lucorum TaxID=248454 RepID=A0A8S9XKT4_APOLU|nr:hypothetical protein GE061_015380 [Apolygus lucorum]